MVVFHHRSRIWIHKYGAGLCKNGAEGMDLFFIISGFVMALSHKKDLSGGEFLKQRIIRVVPLYWLMTFLMLAKITAARAHPTVENSI
jgi:exopolysaccharide production protein ExoZ